MDKDVVKKVLENQLVVDEGLRLKVYLDTKGIETIGVGRNLRDRGITRQEAFYLLDNDINEVLEQLDSAFPWIKTKPDVVWIVLANMCVNMGIERLKQFKKTLLFIEQGEYEKASIEMLNSKWYSDVGARADRLSALLKTI